MNERENGEDREAGVNRQVIKQDVCGCTNKKTPQKTDILNRRI